ncbi:MAG: hypothetical protein AAFP22_09825, partial [Planctomycetota bacterium]
MTFRPLRSSFRLPLSEDALRSALASGHGRAALHVRAHGDAGGALLDACVADGRHDHQADEDRSAWLAALVDDAGLREAVLDRLEGFAEHPSAELLLEDAEHRVAVACGLASSASDMRARRLAFRLVQPHPEQDELVGLDALLELAPVDGILHVARMRGRALRNSSEPREDPWPLDQAESLSRTGEVEDALEAAALEDADVARWISAVAAGTARDAMAARRVSREPSVGDVLRIVRADPLGDHGTLRAFARRASADACAELYAAALVEPNPRIACTLLRALHAWENPWFDERLAALVDEELVHFDRSNAGGGSPILGATSLAGRIAAPEHRALALALLDAGEPYAGWTMLCASAAPEDAARISHADVPNGAGISGRRVPADRDAVTRALLQVGLCCEGPVAARAALDVVYAESPSAHCR